MYFYSFLKQYIDMNWKLRKFQTTVQNYNPKSCVEPEIFKIFQHKVELTPHFTHFSGIVHIFSAFDGEDCASNPCKNGGTCVEGYFNYTCVCPPGRHGERCQCKFAIGYSQAFFLKLDKFSNISTVSRKGLKNLSLAQRTSVGLNLAIPGFPLQHFTNHKFRRYVDILILKTLYMHISLIIF